MKIFAPYSRLTWTLICTLLLLLISVNTYISRSTITELNAINADITRTANIIALLDQLHTDVLKVESAQRGYLLTTDPNYLMYYDDGIEEIEELLAHSSTYVSKIPEQTTAISTLIKLITKKILEINTTIEQASNGKFTDAIDMVKTHDGREIYEQIHILFMHLKSKEKEIGVTQIQKLQQATAESARNLLISFLISLLLIIGIFALARVNIKNQRQRQSEMQLQNEKLQIAVDERTQELSLFSDELARSNRELEDFAFVASHDLQEPLRKIMAFGDRLQSQAENFSDKQKDYLKRMRSAASRMSTLISDLLEFSRISTRGKDFKAVDLNQVVEECIDDLEVLIEETGATIETDPLPTIVADPTQMLQLMFNLIANGVKFSKETAAPSVKISVETCQQPDEIEVEELDNWVSISVKDNGIGFEQEYADKIFAPFQRLHSRDSYKGTGIGLAICRRIVERHNGIIKATGETNKGAVFTVILPSDNYLISIKK